MNIRLLKILRVQPPYAKGYITLLSVLVVGALGVAVTTALILFGLSSSNTSFNYQQMQQAKNLASTCAEEALERIRESSTFVGSGNLSLGQGTCSYSVINTGANSRQIDATSAVKTIVRKVIVNISVIDPLIIISNWQEI